MSQSPCWKYSRFIAMTIVMACISFVTVSVSHAELIAYYNFDDSGDSTIAPDTSGNGYDGDISGPAVYGGPGSGFTGAPGDQAMDFGDFDNGAFIDIPAAADGAFDALIDSQDVTLSMWILGGPQQPVSQWTFYFGEKGNFGTRQLGSHAPWGNANVYWDVSGCCDPDQRINAPTDAANFKDRWNHYVFVKDQDSTAIYINGELFLESNSAISEIKPIGIVRIGSGPSGENSTHGMIDDFGVFDEVLSPERINQIFTERLPLGTPPEPFTINGGGETYFQNFDELGTDARRVPKASGQMNFTKIEVS